MKKTLSTSIRRKPVLLQDPRRYFEQTSTLETGAAAGPEIKTSKTATLSQVSTLDVLRAINPHSLQSGMDPAAAKQVTLLSSINLIETPLA